MWDSSAEALPPRKNREQGQSWDPVLVRMRLARCYLDKISDGAEFEAEMQEIISCISCWLSVAQPRGHVLFYYFPATFA